MSDTKTESMSETKTEKKFVMFGPHMIQANQIDRITCRQPFEGSDLRWVCTAYLPDRMVHTIVESRYDATELNKKMLQDIDKVMNK